MKRLALILSAAAAVLGTGCGASPAPCTSSVTVDWSHGFQLFDGTIGDCTAAGVSQVDVFINNDPNAAASFACAQGAAQAVAVPAGTNLYTVEGIDGSGRIAFRDQVSVGSVCGNQNVQVQPSEGTLVLDYSFSPTNACYATQPTYIWSEVWDNVANQAAFVDASTRGASPVCTTTGTAPSFLLPAGSYTLMGVNEWSPTYGIVGADCTHASFAINGAGTATQTPVLVDSNQACF